MSNHFIKRTSCPVCGSQKAESLFTCGYTEPPVWDYLSRYYGEQGFIEKQLLEGAEYELVECKECKLVYQRFIGDDFLLTKLYTDWINPERALSSDRKRWQLFYYERHAQEIMMFIRYFGKAPADLSFFDFGLGWCEWCFMARGFGVNVSGTELSKDKIEFAKQNGIDVIPFDEIPNHKFDLIHTEQVFEHIAQPYEVMSHLSKALKPGGLLKLSVPWGNDVRGLLRRIDWNAPQDAEWSPMSVAPLEHVNTYPTSTLKALGRRAGLEPIRIGVGVLILDFNKSRFKEGLRTSFRPIYRKMNKKGSYVLFRKPG